MKNRELEGQTFRPTAVDSRALRWALVKKALLVLVGAGLLVLGWMMWSHIEGNPLHELALIKEARVATGVLTQVNDWEEEDFRGRVGHSDAGVYTFVTPEGRRCSTWTRAPVGELKNHVDVEYLPGNPMVNRVKGDGCRSIGDWLLRKVILGAVMFAVCMAIGFAVSCQAIRDFTAECRTYAVQSRLPRGLRWPRKDSTELPGADSGYSGEDLSEKSAPDEIMIRMLQEYSASYLIERKGRSEEVAVSMMEAPDTIRALVVTSRKWLRTDFEEDERPVDFLDSCDFDSPRMKRINLLLDRLSCGEKLSSTRGTSPRHRSHGSSPRSRPRQPSRDEPPESNDSLDDIPF